MKNESLINSMFLIWGTKDSNTKPDAIPSVFPFAWTRSAEKDTMKQ